MSWKSYLAYFVLGVTYFAASAICVATAPLEQSAQHVFGMLLGLTCILALVVGVVKRFGFRYRTQYWWYSHSFRSAQIGSYEVQPSPRLGGFTAGVSTGLVFAYLFAMLGLIR